MHSASSDRIEQWTLQLKEVQDLLSERQNELLHAISSEGPGQDVLRRQVRALSCSAMGIIGEIEKELQRRRGTTDFAPLRHPARVAESAR